MWNDDDEDDDDHFYPVDRLRMQESGNKLRRVLLCALKWISREFATRGTILIAKLLVFTLNTCVSEFTIRFSVGALFIPCDKHTIFPIFLLNNWL